MTVRQKNKQGDTESKRERRGKAQAGEAANW
jgi:hypothetical protein